MKQPNLGRLAEMQRGSLYNTKEALEKKRTKDALSEYSIEYIPISKLEPMSFNKEIYTVDDFDFLSETIKQFGLLQPLVVQKKSGEDRYRIIAGERRYHSYLKMIESEDAPKRYVNGLPCRVFPADMELVEIKIILILANATSRARNQETQLKEFKYLAELFEQAKEKGLEFEYSFKELVMSQLEISERQYQKYMSITRIEPNLADIIEKKAIDINLAAAIGAKPTEVQEEILDRVQKGEEIDEVYEAVNDQYKEYKKEQVQINSNIEELKEKLKEDDLEKDVAESLKQQIKKEKEKKKVHKQSLKETLKKKEPEMVLEKTLEKKSSPEALDPFSMDIHESLEYLEKATRSLFIYAKQMNPEDLDALKILKEKLKAADQAIETVINRAENSGEFTV